MSSTGRTVQNRKMHKMCIEIFGVSYTFYLGIIQSLAYKAAKQGLVLDAGCGSTGIDPTNVGLDLSRENAKKWVKCRHQHKPQNERMAVVASVDALPFRDEAFNTVLCNDVLEHVQNKNLAVKELCRICTQVIGCTSNLLNAVMLIDTLLPRFMAQTLAEKFFSGEQYERNGIRFTPATISKAFHAANFKVEISVFGGPVSKRLFFVMLWSKIYLLTSWLKMPVGEEIFFRAKR
jgi:SAM-dependent methyltransferase